MSAADARSAQLRSLRLAGQVRLHAEPGESTAVAHALRFLLRDLRAVLGAEPQLAEDERTAQLVVRTARGSDGCPDRPEAFVFRFERREDAQDAKHIEHAETGPEQEVRMVIAGRDELGLVYGLLEFGRIFLGVQPLGYWMDRSLLSQSELVLACEPYDSPPRRVRYRGWFVNDEVSLIGWTRQYPPPREVWEPVFEALLRCGGNMVIAGTDLPRHGIHHTLASEMGLIVTHHHAEPLGAQMFLRAYPGYRASYREEPERYERLWRQAIEEQKDRRILWVLSFRGQGDKPFWEDDPFFDTPQKRGELISRAMRRQYELIRESVSDPVCCVALYGEISELYKAGWIELPEGAIKIWADNGYGKMVSRRHGNLNLRTPALPAPGESGPHGLYYHVTFHDLQASNHLTMFPGSAEFLRSEIQTAFDAGADEYLLVNCGGIRPHVYPLDVLRTLWNDGTIDADRHRAQFVRNYYTSGHEELERLYRTYPDAALAYGPNADDLAGDEYYHHPARQIIGRWIEGRTPDSDPRLDWAAESSSWAGQVQRFEQKLKAAIPKWEAWLRACDEAAKRLEAGDRQRMLEHLRFHGELHASGCAGFYLLCRSYGEYAQGRLPEAFVLASESMSQYERGVDALRAAEHGKWADFYRADWLTNIASTVRSVDTLRRVLRVQGDGPDFFLWFKQYLMPETEKYIYLENTHREPLEDDELARRLKQRLFGETADLLTDSPG